MHYKLHHIAVIQCTTLPKTTDKISYFWQLVATEKSTSERLSTTATLTVNILDVNDNFPQFNEPKYITSVMESAPPGTTIGKITVSTVVQV